VRYDANQFGILREVEENKKAAHNVPLFLENVILF